MWQQQHKMGKSCWALPHISSFHCRRQLFHQITLVIKTHIHITFQLQSSLTNKQKLHCQQQDNRIHTVIRLFIAIHTTAGIVLSVFRFYFKCRIYQCLLLLFLSFLILTYTIASQHSDSNWPVMPFKQHYNQNTNNPEYLTERLMAFKLEIADRQLGD